MAKKSEQALRKHTMNLFAGDWETLQMLHPDVGAAEIIRRLVHGHIAKVEAAYEQKTKQLTLNFEDLT